MSEQISPANELVESVIKCMEIASQRRPGRFDARRAALYTGLQCEELAEKLKRLWIAGSNQGRTPLSAEQILIRQLAMRLDEVATDFKAGKHDDLLQAAPADKLIDDDFDLAWVSIGALEATAADAVGAVQEGIRSNLAKFPDGKAILDANGKYQKPANWQPPNFMPYTDPTRGID